MERHYEFTDDEFQKRFQNCTLHPAIFTHEAHLRLAWIHIRQSGVDKAIENIRFQLKRFVENIGSATKYNETVTVAAIKAVSHFMNKSKKPSFRDFIVENEQLKSNFRKLLASHYQTDIFNSTIARERYLTPELLPFD